MESERVSRSRRFETAGAADAAQFRAENPENPLPLLSVVLDDPPPESHGRWAALLASSSRFDITVVFLGRSPIATGQLGLDAERRVLHATPAERLGTLLGSQLFGLRSDEATDVLGAVTDAAHQDDPDEDPSSTADIIDVRVNDPSTGARSTHDRNEPSPDTPPSLLPERTGDRPIAVRVFGHFEVTVHGEPVVTGLRTRARDLLGWFLIHPEGATSDQAVDALWPDTEPDRVNSQFWRSFSDLRTRLKQTGDGDLEVLTKVGGHYRPCPAEITCDLWDFQGALGEASRADNDDTARVALRRAVDAYRGDLLARMDMTWVEPIRADFHRRGLDAHLRLAELEEHSGRLDAAVDVLERAIARDRYAEEPYRRLMVLHAAHDRLGAVGDVWRLLQGRLAELDLDIEPATADLYHQITAGQRPQAGADRVQASR